MTILINKLTMEDINAALLRLQRSMKNEQASLEGKVTNIVSGSSKANGNSYNDSLLRQLIKALQDTTADHTKQINNLTEEQNTFNKKIQSLTTMLGNISWSYNPETKVATYTDKDGKAKTWEIKDTTYTFSFDDTTQTLSIHDDTQTKVNPDWNPSDPESSQYIPDNTHDFVQQIKGTTYTFTWAGGKLTIHNNLSTEEHPIADVVIDFDGRYYTESEIDAFINSIDTRLDYIEDRIPQEATPENKLADKNWVARAISISAATFRGTFNSLADLEAYSGPKDQNDFAFVKTSTGYDQYTWVPSGSSGSWTYEFSLETLAGSLSVEVDNCNHSVYLAGTTTCSGCDNINALCGSSDIHFNPVKRQLFANNMVLDPDETCSGSYSGGLRINRGLVSGADYWNGLILGGQRGTTCGCTEAWWVGNDYSTNNVSGNNGKLFVTYEGAASENQRRGYFTKSSGETLWRGNVSGNICKDADLVNWKYINLSALDSNTIYPVVFSLLGDNSIVRIRIRNALDGAPVPSWATHGNGFAAELDMYDQPYGWGIIGRRTYVRQADINWVNDNGSKFWGYSQLTNTSIGVLWLRGGAIWHAWTSADTPFTVMTSTWDDGTGETVAPTTPGSQPSLYTSNGISYDTVSNAIKASCACSVIDYNDTSHPIQIGFRGAGLSTTSYLAAYSADGSCIKDLAIPTAKCLLAPNFLELANPTECSASDGTIWSKELFTSITTNVGYRDHQGILSRNGNYGCMGIYIGRGDGFVPGTCSNGTCYWFSPNGEITGTNDSRCGIELVGRARNLSVYNDDLNAICDNLSLLAKNYGDSNNLIYLKGWCPSCQTCITTRVDQAYWSYCADSVCLYNQTGLDADFELPTAVNATPGAWSLLGITCCNCGKPTWNPAQQTLKAPRIVAGTGGIGFNNNTINNYYSSTVPYVCIADYVNNQPLYVRVCFLQNRNQAGGHFHISHYTMDATINLDQAGRPDSPIAYYCGGTYGTTYFSIPPYTCNTQYLWLYFASSWWSPRISADIPFCIDTYRSLDAAKEAEIGLGGGWHNFTDIRNSGGSVDNATCFNGYTWAQACAIFTGSVTPSVRCDDAWYEVLGVDTNGNLVKSGCNNMWFNPSKQMNAMCAITTNPVNGNYTEGIRLNRSNTSDPWTSFLIGDCWGTYCGNCDGIWIGRHHSAADNQKLFFTWQCSTPTNNCGYMYFPTSGQGACWCGNVLGYATCNIGSFLGTDGILSNYGDWHKLVTNSGVSGGQWQHVLNLNWITADNEWTSRLYLPTNYMTNCKHMYFSTNCAGCAWEVLDNGADTQCKNGGLLASWYATSGLSQNKQTGTLSAGTTYYIHLYDIDWGNNAYRGTVDVDYSIYGSGVVDSINLRASSNGYDNSLESMGVCLNRTSYSCQSDPAGNSGLVGIGFIHNTAYQGSLQVWGKFIAYDNWDYTQYLGMNFVNTRNLSWCGNGVTTTSPTFTCFVCVKPNGQQGFHWFNGSLKTSGGTVYDSVCTSTLAMGSCCLAKAVLSFNVSKNICGILTVCSSNGATTSTKISGFIAGRQFDSNTGASDSDKLLVYGVGSGSNNLQVFLASCCGVTLTASWSCLAVPDSSDLISLSLTTDTGATPTSLCKYVPINNNYLSGQSLISDISANTVSAYCIASSSSIKCKKDINKWNSSALSILNSIDVVQYKYKSENANDLYHIGFIAENTNSLLSGKNQNEMRLNDTIGVLLKAVQELTPWYIKLINRIKRIFHKDGISFSK